MLLRAALLQHQSTSPVETVKSIDSGPLLLPLPPPPVIMSESFHTPGALSVLSAPWVCKDVV